MKVRILAFSGVRGEDATQHKFSMHGGEKSAFFTPINVSSSGNEKNVDFLIARDFAKFLENK